MTQASVRSGQHKLGLVVGKPGAKTIKVLVERLFPHPMYKRVIRRSKCFLVHDEREACQVGDRVEISEARPLSARKRWRVRRIVTHAEGRAAAADLIEPGSLEV